MNDTTLQSVPYFGSACRRERDDPAYQASRQRLLCAFALRLAKAYSDQLRETQRRAAEVWRGSRWLDEQLSQQKQWNQQLEEGKAWLTEQWQNWMRVAQEREQFLNEQKTWSDQLQAINAGLDRRVQDCMQTVERQREALERRHERIRLLESELARLAERGNRHD